MVQGAESGKDDVRLQAFVDIDGAGTIKPYIAALEAFDALAQLQQLKVLARAHAGIGPGAKVVDVGCGFGLESLRLARMVQPGGIVAGLDKSAEFIAEAKARAEQAKLDIDFQVGDAEALPYGNAAFDVARAERLLVYLPEPARALAEMRRVTRPGGIVTVIEPDFGTNAVNLPDRSLVRRVLDHECDANIPHGLLVRDLAAIMRDVGLRDVTIDTRVVLFTPELAADYFTETGKTAQGAGVIDTDELARWSLGLEDLRQKGRLFAGIGYYLFTGQV